MRALSLTLLLGLAGLSGCIDDVTESACDQYVDYLCTCEPESCDEIQGRFSGELAVEEQCRIDLACFEEADATNGEVCSIVGTEDEGQCLEG